MRIAFWFGSCVAMVTMGCGEVRTQENDSEMTVDAAVIDASLLPVLADASTDCPVGAICEPGYNFAFVTSLKIPMGEFGGVGEADLRCNTLASEVGLPGQYVAFLSTRSEDARGRLGTANGWLRPDRRPFAMSQSSLFNDGLILYPLSLDERGDQARGAVATGSDRRGLRSGDTCGDWSGDLKNGESNTAQVGLAEMGSQEWLEFNEETCEEDARLYCFGTDHNQPITAPTFESRLAWLSETVGAGAGVENMDALCLADAVLLGRTSARAFVATVEEAAAGRFNLAGSTWSRLDGIPLWETAQDIALTGPLAPIHVQANGIPGPPAALVWTGAASASAFSNTVGTDNCQEWTSASVNDRAKAGQSAANGVGSFNKIRVPCNVPRRIYCLEE